MTTATTSCPRVTAERVGPLIPSTDGVEIALHDLGGSGPPLLILHATGFHGRCYSAIAERLHDHFSVWAPDLRGHGDSITPDMDLPWRGMVADVKAVLDHLGIDEPVRAVGHSMGGATVINVELHHPGTIRAAWLFEPIIFPGMSLPAGRANPMAEAARRRRHDFASFDEVIERYAGRPPFADWTDRALHDYVHHGFAKTESGVTLKCTGEQEARVFEGIDLTLFDQLGRVDIPVTVVGSGDGDNPAAAAAGIADALVRGVDSRWPDRSHMGPFEAPARAAQEITAALK